MPPPTPRLPRQPAVTRPIDIRPIRPGSVQPRPMTAMVIVVEENEAQSNSVTWKSIFRDTAAVMDAPLSALDLKMPHELKTFLANSGNAVEKLLKEIHKAMAQAVQSLVREAGVQMKASSATGLKQYVNTLERTLSVPGSFAEFKNDYGEAAFAGILEKMARPHYAKVVVLTDRTASFDSFKRTLEQLHAEGYTIDVLLDVHGCGDSTTMNNGHCSEDVLIFSDRRVTIADLKTINGGAKMNLNAVMMISCWGSRFNDTWVNALGARASNGSEELNYYVLLTPFAFMQSFMSGNSLKTAAKHAYNLEKALLNGKKIEITFAAFRNPITGKKKEFSVEARVTWRKLMDRQLAKFYGKDKDDPVDNVASSARVALNDSMRAGEAASRLPV